MLKAVLGRGARHLACDPVVLSAGGTLHRP
jgi:hypothetical protein